MGSCLEWASARTLFWGYKSWKETQRHCGKKLGLDASACKKFKTNKIMEAVHSSISERCNDVSSCCY